MGRVDATVARVRAWIDQKLPWYDEKAAARQHRTTQQVIARADAVLEGRTDLMLGSYRRSGKRLTR